MNATEVVLELKSSGKKITKLRRSIIDIFFSTNLPLSVSDITTKLKSSNILVNKTSIYRELAFMLREGLLREVRISAKTTHYESNKSDHHHHLICESCGEIKDVVVDESRIIKNIKKSHFKITNHSMEFFGLCQACQ